MEHFGVFKTDKGNFAVRPMDWAGVWNAEGKIQECGLRHTAVFAEKEDADWYADIKNKESQGLLAHFNCKVGDKVYAFLPDDNHFTECQVVKIEVKPTLYGKICYSIAPVDNRWEIYRFFEDEFWKTIFLTQPEAALAQSEIESRLGLK